MAKKSNYKDKLIAEIKSLSQANGLLRPSWKLQQQALLRRWILPMRRNAKSGMKR